MKVLNFGSINKDFIYSVNDFVNPGETISSIKYNIKIILDGEERGKDLINFNKNGNIKLATQVSRSNFLNTLKKSLVQNYENSKFWIHKQRLLLFSK